MTEKLLTEEEALRRKIEEVLATLTPRERKVIVLRFGLSDGRPHTLEEVAQHMHTDTQTTIRRLETLMKEGEISATKQGRKTVYFLSHEEEAAKV